MANELVKEPLVEGNKSYKDVTDDICRPLESFPTKRWYVAISI